MAQVQAPSAAAAPAAINNPFFYDPIIAEFNTVVPGKVKVTNAVSGALFDLSQNTPRVLLVQTSEKKAWSLLSGNVENKDKKDLEKAKIPVETHFALRALGREGHQETMGAYTIDEVMHRFSHHLLAPPKKIATYGDPDRVLTFAAEETEKGRLDGVAKHVNFTYAQIPPVLRGSHHLTEICGAMVVDLNSFLSKWDEIEKEILRLESPIAAEAGIGKIEFSEHKKSNFEGLKKLLGRELTNSEVDLFKKTAELYNAEVMTDAAFKIPSYTARDLKYIREVANATIANRMADACAKSNPEFKGAAAAASAAE